MMSNLTRKKGYTLLVHAVPVAAYNDRVDREAFIYKIQNGVHEKGVKKWVEVVLWLSPERGS